MNDATPTPAELERARRHLRRAAELSVEGSRAGHGGPFGAVIVRAGTDEVVAEAFNRVLAGNDPTAHAEVEAIRRACAALQTFELKGYEIFASGQPCPMCLSAIYWARLDRVWYANTLADAAAIGFDDSTFYDELSMKPEERSIPQIHVAVAEALAAFKEWAQNEGRTRY